MTIVRALSPALDNDAYTVGWITALALEAAAAEAMLDIEHGEPRWQSENDENNYTLGSVGKHNIVIVSLPERYGPTAAATAVNQMLSTFKSIRIGLLVGIGGGIPNLDIGQDIRLGDIVVSQPHGTSGGVTQYDFGKTTAGGLFEMHGSLNSPPRVLLNAVNKLKRDHLRFSSKVPSILNEFWVNNPLMAKPRHGTSYEHQGIINDRLFDSKYIHNHSAATCGECEEQFEIKRNSRDSLEPVIHYGTIASGNQVIKDANVRDKLGRNCLCFDMEAAGLMNDFPCIVIRGICDYADSHKNKKWQNYAAATAAAYAKELLQVTPDQNVQNLKRAIDVMVNKLNSIQDEVSNATHLIHGITERIEDQYSQQLLDWLSPTNFPAQHSSILERKQEDTGDWFMNSPQFQKWFQGSNQTLFCSGIPGAGKSMIAAIVIQHIQKVVQRDDSVGLAFILFNYKDHSDVRTIDLASAILKQLVSLQGFGLETLSELRKVHSKTSTRPSLEQIMSALELVVRNYSKLYIIVDALDECPDSWVWQELLTRLGDIQGKSDLSLMVTSRFNTAIEKSFQGSPRLEIRADSSDIRRFIEAQISRLHECVQNDLELQSLVYERIFEAVDGMFLLARLRMESLIGKRTKTAIKRALDRLSTGSDALTNAYSEAVRRIDSQSDDDRVLAKRVISWTTCTKRPLTSMELCHALAVELGAEDLDPDNIMSPAEIPTVCCGLVTIDKQGYIRLVHHTAQEFFEQYLPTWNPATHYDLSSTCLTYLCFNIFKAGSCPNDDTFKQRISQNAFLQYAAEFWVDHTLPVQDEVVDLILALAIDDSLVSCALQAMSVLNSNWCNYSQQFPKSRVGLHLLAKYGFLKPLAMAMKDRSIVRSLNCKDQYGRTPISFAAENGLEAAVKVLLDQDEIDPDAADNHGQTPLSYAASSGHQEVVKMLLERAEVDVASKNVGGRTPLLIAANNGHKEVVELFLGREEVDVNVTDNDDETPLLSAARYGQEAIVELLLEREELDVNSKDRTGCTALSWASQNRYENVVDLLLKNRKIDVNLRDNYSQTPLLWAAEYSCETIVKLLLERADVDVNFQDERGRTPLSWAAENGSVAIVQFLLGRQDIHVNLPDDYGQTPLSWAAEKGHEAVVKLLLEREDIDVKFEDKKGSTPLSFACKNGEKAVVKLLLECEQVDVNPKDWTECTPLCWAVKNGWESIVRLLLEEKHINVNSKDYRGRTPLLWALYYGHDAVADLLIARGGVAEAESANYEVIQ